MLVNQYIRQTGLFNPLVICQPMVTIIGAGGIGSHVVLVLAKMGLTRLRVFDPDTIDVHNVSNQLYGPDQIGEFKVYALAHLIKAATGTVINDAFPEAYVNQPLSEIVISGLDSLETRRVLWHQIRCQWVTNLYIDGRMGGEQVTVFPVDIGQPDQVKAYTKSIQPRVVAEDVPCTERAIIYSLWFCAAAIGKIIQAHLTDQVLPTEFLADLRNFNLFFVQLPQPSQQTVVAAAVAEEVAA